jgi:hypothetical protein
VKAIFIVGTGRSGTHFTARLLAGFAHVRDPWNGEESDVVRREVAFSAVHHRQLGKAAVNYFAGQLWATGPNEVFLDQHHPNLFHIPQLLRVESDAIFLYPRRPIEQIVASMLTHRSVLSWYQFAERNPIPFPNAFLGLESADQMTHLAQHVLCAKRVLAHERKFAEMTQLYPDKVRAVDYVALVETPQRALEQLFSSAELARLGPYAPKIDAEKSSLTKYQQVLTPAQIAEVKALNA